MTGSPWEFAIVLSASSAVFGLAWHFVALLLS
jgi:hypothetical protein